MVPKIIHYCWFGGAEKSELVQKCLASWKKYCPDYSIIEWNEENWNVNYNQYTYEAFQEKSGRLSQMWPGWMSSTVTADYISTLM